MRPSQQGFKSEKNRNYKCYPTVCEIFWVQIRWRPLQYMFSLVLYDQKLSSKSHCSRQKKQATKEHAEILLSCSKYYRSSREKKKSSFSSRIPPLKVDCHRNKVIGCRIWAGNFVFRPLTLNNYIELYPQNIITWIPSKLTH